MSKTIYEILEEISLNSKSTCTYYIQAGKPSPHKGKKKLSRKQRKNNL